MTVFDLISWTSLLQLVASIEEMKNSIDINVWDNLGKEIRAAALRKAEALDDLKQTDFHRITLKGLIP